MGDANVTTAAGELQGQATLLVHPCAVPTAAVHLCLACNCFAAEAAAAWAAVSPHQHVL